MTSPTPRRKEKVALPLVWSNTLPPFFSLPMYLEGEGSGSVQTIVCTRFSESKVLGAVRTPCPCSSARSSVHQAMQPHPIVAGQ